MPLNSMNPATGGLLRSFPALTDEALRGRIEGAAAAAPVHRAIPLEVRALYLRKLASLLEVEAPELARTITLETGKPLRWSLVEVARCAEVCSYYAEHAARLLAPELLSASPPNATPGEQGQAYVQWSPVGVVLAVMPGESPLWHAVRFAVPALIAGNVVLLKLAEDVPQCALALESLVRRAGFERGALSALLLEDGRVELVLNDERVAAVTVTGSVSVGRALAAQAGWLLKRSAMHLHSSDAMVVMPSCDLDAAGAAAARALTGAEGEGAAKRLVIHTAVFNEFVATLVEAVESMRVGDPLKDETEVGPLGSAGALRTLKEQVQAVVAAGGRIVSGGAVLVGGKGYFFEPTLLSDVPRTAAVAKDVIVGPAAMLFRARDLDDAIAIANDSLFGASASVWTKEPAEQEALLNSIEAGAVTLNALPTFDPRLPVGGSKGSGYGRELGAAGLREFMQAKTVFVG